MTSRFACLILLTAALIRPTAAAEFDAAVATNQVGLDLFRQLAARQPDKNLVLSPYSIESALALVYAGADGTTRAEMGRALHFPNDDASVHPTFAALRTALEQTALQAQTFAEQRHRQGGKVDRLEWHVANRLFGQRDYAFRASFLTLLKDGYAAPFNPLDFTHDSESARATINTWVEDQTRRKIRDLIPRGGVDADTRLVLVNALYLKAPWQTPFQKTATRSLPFHIRDSDTRDVPTMHDTAFRGYAAEDGLQVLTLDYLGRGLQFLVLLPDKGENIDTVAAKLTPAHFARWARLTDQKHPKVALYLPKFRVEGSTIPLGQALRTLGMKSAFNEPAGTADFGRMAPRTGDDYLALSEVFHQTFIALDEEGTEAAAATAAPMSVFGSFVLPSEPIEVRVDRPFLFAIQHRASGACLFFGRITDPR